MNQIETILTNATDFLQKLYGLPALGMVLLCCLMVGYCLRFVKAFPNDAIPLAVILVGGVVSPVIADDNNDLTLRVWLVRNVIIGLVTGFAAWVLHKVALSKLEEKVFSTDTTFMNKPVALPGPAVIVSDVKVETTAVKPPAP